MEPSPRIDGTVPLRLIRDVVLLSRHFHALIDPAVKREHGLTSNDLYVMRSITLGVNRPSSIGRRLGLSAPSVSRAIDRLVAARFVERHHPFTDARATELRLTASGADALECAYGIAAERFEQHHGQLDQTLVVRAAAALRDLLEAMGNGAEPTS